MFTPEQKRYIYENSVKVNDNHKYIEIMGYFTDYFSKAKKTSVKRKIIFVFLLLIIVYMSCQYFLQPIDIGALIFRCAAIFVLALLVLKLGLILLNYIDDMPVIDKIKSKEFDMLYYEGDLNDVTKFINYKSTSSRVYDYFITVSGNKYDVDRATYKILLPNKGKKVRIYYFAELLNRQMLISDAAVIIVEQ